MPELPEVQKAVGTINNAAKGKLIQSVDTKEDTILFDGITHTEFASELQGRKVLEAHRYGKCFYITLSGPGRHPVLHFGMTGMIQIKGQLDYYYKSSSSKASLPSSWPPKFWKFVLHLIDPENPDAEPTELALCDARRLGRVRLREEPLKSSPISELGFDPILCMPDLDTFSAQVLKRTCPIKALLLDQSFSAGVGNWVADEVLYNARIHPEQKANTLSEEQIKDLHFQVEDVCKIAVEVNADSDKFPEHWLFKHRWGKGKKGKNESASTLKLPSGEPATIKFITVGGRTSAYVAELQRLTGSSKSKVEKAAAVVQDAEEEESELTALSDVEANMAVKKRKRTKKAPARKRGKKKVEEDVDD